MKFKVIRICTGFGCQFWNPNYSKALKRKRIHRDWSTKLATGLNVIIDWSSESIWVTRLLFCQNDYPMRASLRQKDSLITHILFELQPITIFSSVKNFGDQSLNQLWLYIRLLLITFYTSFYTDSDLKWGHFVSICILVCKYVLFNFFLIRYFSIMVDYNAECRRLN